jgi:hypothetical protein
MKDSLRREVFYDACRSYGSPIPSAGLYAAKDVCVICTMRVRVQERVELAHDVLPFYAMFTIPFGRIACVFHKAPKIIPMDKWYAYAYEYNKDVTDFKPEAKNPA